MRLGAYDCHLKKGTKAQKRMEKKKFQNVTDTDMKLMQTI